AAPRPRTHGAADRHLPRAQPELCADTFAGRSLQRRSSRGRRLCPGGADRGASHGAQAAGRLQLRRTSNVPVRAAPAGDVQFQAAGDPQHRRGLGHQAQDVRDPRRPKTSVGVLRTGRAAAGHAGRAQFRQGHDLRRSLSEAVPDGIGGVHMKAVVVRNITRADADVVKRLAALGVATVHEAYGRFGLMKPYLRPIWAGGEAAGTAVTVLAQPGDNWMIHVAVEQCRPGDILAVGCTADNTDGMFGDLLATSLMARGVVGLVIDAGCRDVKSLKEMGFPVWSKAISAKGTVKATLGAVNVPVICAGINVHPGDAVIADDDGVVVVGKKHAAEVAVRGEKRQADEEGKRRQLASGVLGLDMYNRREPLAKAGLVYIDEPESD